jgi:hypothetical protein
MSTAYYSSSIPDFLLQSSSKILGLLANAHRFALEQTQRDAWVSQIMLLKRELAGIGDGEIHFEFVIPRMGKRADCIVVYRDVVFVLEFKVGSSQVDAAAIEQVHDYALDLKNFHRGSHSAVIIPVMIATKAITKISTIVFATDLVAKPVPMGSTDLRTLLDMELPIDFLPSLDLNLWANSGYLPTPTIIEAAQALYQEHEVTEIARSDAGVSNLATTDARISSVIEASKRDGRKAICFVTGVPGAGKTLAGLNIATKRSKAHSDEHAVFLSGNGPLVTVLREALARDQKTREGIKKEDAKRKVNSFIQNIHHFRDEYLSDQGAPIEKVVVFDEAQRAWTREQASKFMQQKRALPSFDQSEPEFLVSVMDRHDDWCVIVCLIGGGQEINTGEAGIGEWLIALQDRFPHWDVHASSLLAERNYTIDAVARQMLEAPTVTRHPDLHLAVSMRSFRAEQLNGFVSGVLNGDAGEARAAHKDIAKLYPIRITRDLPTAREWLREKARGSERFGLVASSGAARLRPEGLHVKSEISPKSWFLNDRFDVRSSFALEEIGTEFDVQGLELDWSGLCWDADLRFGHDGWEKFKFRGTVWQNVNLEANQRYLVNAYRVLLTRARQGMVIFVPNGDDRDVTRPTKFYDGTYDYLCACGAEPL